VAVRGCASIALLLLLLLLLQLAAASQHCVTVSVSHRPSRHDDSSTELCIEISADDVVVMLPSAMT